MTIKLCYKQIHNLDHLYADNTQIYISLAKPGNCRSLKQHRHCVQDVLLWMKNSKLKLNADMIDFLIIGTQRSVENLMFFSPDTSFESEYHTSRLSVNSWSND